MQNDGKSPIEPGFDHMIYYRNKIRKDLFSETAGLLGNHGEEWYDVRSKVCKFIFLCDVYYMI